MRVKPVCEPIAVPAGLISIRNVIVSEGATEPANCAHFHDVCEIVIFEAVKGSFMAGGRRYPLQAGSVAFAPSMQIHDFDIEKTERAWWLLHVDASVIEQLKQSLDTRLLNDRFCVNLDPVVHGRVMVLINWLQSLGGEARSGRMTMNIVELIVSALLSGDDVASVVNEDGTVHYEKVARAIQQLRRFPDNPLSLSDAASMCSMSGAYFSKQFRRTYGTSYAAYVLNYRLSLAARQIVDTRRALAEISYGLGFMNVSHFSARFKRRFGLTPREYRKKGREHAGSRCLVPAFDGLDQV